MSNQRELTVMQTPVSLPIGEGVDSLAEASPPTLGALLLLVPLLGALVGGILPALNTHSLSLQPFKNNFRLFLWILVLWDLLLCNSQTGWQRGEAIACEEQDTEVWQNPQVTDGLRRQAVEGKVQELWCKDRRQRSRSSS